MTEPGTRILSTDPNIYHKIKIAQIKRQTIPIIVMIIGILINVFWSFVGFQILTIACFGWYLWERIIFRTKRKIARPEPDTCVAPFDGKVISVLTGEDTTIVTLKKSILDVVELRLPLPNPVQESPQVWHFDTKSGPVDLRISAPSLKVYEHRNIHADVIGIIPGNATAMLHLPATVHFKLEPKNLIFGGETVLFDLNEAPVTVQERISILVEEPLGEEPDA